VVSLWRYASASRSYQGWHLSADDAGCRSLLDLAAVLSTSPTGACRTISVTQPSQRLLAVVNCNSPAMDSIPKLRISHSAMHEDWSLVAEREHVALTLGETWRLRLLDAVEAMSRGEGDFLFGPRHPDQRIWFWWWPA
jgi:hypothetical protein